MLVLRDYELRDGVTLEHTSRFRDDTWVLNPAMHQTHQRALSLHFATLPQPYRQQAKEVLCAYMAGPLPPGEPRSKLPTIRSQFTELKRFLTWLHEHRGTPDLAALTGEDLLAYSRHVSAELTVKAADHACRSVRRIWHYRSALRLSP